MLIRQSPSRSLRTMRGLKVKRAAQIFLILAFFVWLLYQVRRSRYKNTEHGSSYRSQGLFSDDIDDGKADIKYGRKDLTDSLDVSYAAKGHYDRADEEDENGENGVEGRGIGDDEIDDNDHDKADQEDPQSELEDLIDEEDREKEDAGLEEDTEEDHLRRGKGSYGSMNVNQNDDEESNSRLVDGARDGLHSDNSEEYVNNKEDPSFFRDRLIDSNENS